jgi:hypothetical protein
VTQTGLGFDFDYLAAGAFNLLSQAGEVADEALKQMKAGTYDTAALSKSVGALTSLSVESYLECAAKVFGTVSGGPFLSKKITVTPDATFPREVTIGPMTRVGMLGQTIPLELVSPSPKVIPPGATTFQVCVASPFYVGANYSATVTLRKLGFAATPPTSEDIPVTVPL